MMVRLRETPILIIDIVQVKLQLTCRESLLELHRQDAGWDQRIPYCPHWLAQSLTQTTCLSDCGAQNSAANVCRAAGWQLLLPGFREVDKCLVKEGHQALHKPRQCHSAPASRFCMSNRWSCQHRNVHERSMTGTEQIRHACQNAFTSDSKFGQALASAILMLKQHDVYLRQKITQL